MAGSSPNLWLPFFSLYHFSTWRLPCGRDFRFHGEVTDGRRKGLESPSFLPLFSSVRLGEGLKMSTLQFFFTIFALSNQKNYLNADGHLAGGQRQQQAIKITCGAKHLPTKTNLVRDRLSAQDPPRTAPMPTSKLRFGFLSLFLSLRMTVWRHMVAGTFRLQPATRLVYCVHLITNSSMGGQRSKVDLRLSLQLLCRIIKKKCSNFCLPSQKCLASGYYRQT